jgi:hypothetical protein
MVMVFSVEIVMLQHGHVPKNFDRISRCSEQRKSELLLNFLCLTFLT